MNDAQRDALDKVRSILDEHFEAWVLSFQTENDDNTDIVDVRWHGGFATALGLSEYARKEMWDRQKEKYP